MEMEPIDSSTIESLDHGKHLLLFFRQLYHEDRYCDVTIRCDDNFVVRAHRVIMASFSTHFETALSGSDGSADITLEIDSNVTGVPDHQVKIIIDFMYSSAIDPNETGLIESAKCLGCVSLLQLLQSEEAMAGNEVQDASHAFRLLEFMRKFYMENRFCDVNLQCQGIPLTQCHRTILAAYSHHFDTALCRTDDLPNVTLDIDSDITGVTSADLRSIIDFLYSGLVRVSSRRYRTLLAASRALNVHKLIEVLEAYPHHFLSNQNRLNSLSSSSHQVIGLKPPKRKETVPKRREETVIETPSDGQPINGEEFLCLPTTGEQDESIVNVVGANEDVGDETNKANYVNDSIIIDDEGDDMNDSSNNFFNPPSTSQISSDRFSDPQPDMINGDGLSPTDDYVEIYQEYVQSSGKKSGTYISVENQRTLKAPKSRRTTRNSQQMKSSYAVVINSDGERSFVVGDQMQLMLKPFKCPYCDHRTKEKSALEKHIRCLHTLEAPYKCQFCSQQFKVQSNLVRHIRAHTGEKPYACKKCGQAYADKKNMDAHVYREHLKMKPLECPVNGCPARFWRQDRLNDHCSKVHNFEPDQPNLLIPSSF